MAARQAVLLFGPTAAGKTGAGIQLANALGSEIINADSRQVYRGMPIITAMPTLKEQAQAPHHLFAFLDPSQPFSVGAWLQAAREQAEAIWQRGNIPIFVGGTGFYLTVLQYGISPMPETDRDILNSTQKRLLDEGHKALFYELEQIDPVWAASIDPNNTHRLLRGLSIYKQTGKTLTSWQQENKKGALQADFVKLAISPKRDVLNARIHSRYQQMVDDGVLEEAHFLYNTYLRTMPPDGVPPPAFKSIGLMDYAAYFSGEITEAQAHQRVQQQMRRYAKRQRTWLRNSYQPDKIYPSGADGTEMTEFVRNALLKRCTKMSDESDISATDCLLKSKNSTKS